MLCSEVTSASPLTRHPLLPRPFPLSSITLARNTRVNRVDLHLRQDLAPLAREIAGRQRMEREAEEAGRFARGRRAGWGEGEGEGGEGGERRGREGGSEKGGDENVVEEIVRRAREGAEM